MRTRFHPVLVALALVALLLGAAQPAYACSVAADFDAVGAAEVIVAGRMVRWEPLERTDDNPFTPVRVEMAVDRVFKGDGVETIQFVDQSSLMGDGANQTWQGMSGACGAFNEDPAGQYAVLGLSKNEDGTYAASGPLVFFIGAEPAGDAYTQAVSRIAGALGTAPTTGPAGTPLPTNVADPVTPEPPPSATDGAAEVVPTSEPTEERPPAATAAAPAGEPRAEGTIPAVLLGGLVVAGLAGGLIVRERNRRLH